MIDTSKNNIISIQLEAIKGKWIRNRESPKMNMEKSS